MNHLADMIINDPGWDPKTMTNSHIFSQFFVLNFY
jgi:hypothetical protein